MSWFSLAHMCFADWGLPIVIESANHRRGRDRQQAVSMLVLLLCGPPGRQPPHSITPLSAFHLLSCHLVFVTSSFNTAAGSSVSLACAADYLFLILTSAVACRLSLNPLTYLLAGSEGLCSVSSALQWFTISAFCCLSVIWADGSHPVELPISSCHSFAHVSVPANSQCGVLVSCRGDQALRRSIPGDVHHGGGCLALTVLRRCGMPATQKHEQCTLIPLS